MRRKVRQTWRYVFASGGKVYTITNQDDKDLATHAGHTVILMGEMKGDSITVSKIEMPKGTGGSRVALNPAGS